MAPDYSDPEVKLMAHIRDLWGAEIADACHTSSVRPDFLAALIANESRGDVNARRFEPTVFGKLLLVCAGKQAAYAPAGIKKPLGADDLRNFIDPGQYTNSLSDILTNACTLATSWGLTQIMGWHCLELEQPSTALSVAGGQLRATILLLAWFAERYQLNLGTEDEQLLRCWNTGHPDGVTYDPQYVANGLHRAEIYRSLLADAPKVN